jgi:hypothetical protein
VIRHFKTGNTNPHLYKCPVVHIGVKEMQTNGSRLGQVIIENYDFIQLMREREQAIGGILVREVGQAGNKNSSEQSHDEELDNEEEGWDNMSDKEDISEQEAED